MKTQCLLFVANVSLCVSFSVSLFIFVSLCCHRCWSLFLISLFLDLLYQTCSSTISSSSTPASHHFIKMQCFYTIILPDYSPTCHDSCTSRLTDLHLVFCFFVLSHCWPVFIWALWHHSPACQLHLPPTFQPHVNNLQFSWWTPDSHPSPPHPTSSSSSSSFAAINLFHHHSICVLCLVLIMFTTDACSKYQIKNHQHVSCSPREKAYMTVWPNIRPTYCEICRWHYSNGAHYKKQQRCV